MTDAGGQFRISPQRITAQNKNEQIICALNLDRLVRDNTTDMMVQKLFDDVKVTTFVLPVELIKPVFYISVNAKIFANHTQAIILKKNLPGCLGRMVISCPM